MIRRAVPGDAAEVAALEADLFGTDAWSSTAVAAALAGDPAETGRLSLVHVEPVSTSQEAPGTGRVTGYLVLRTVDGTTDLERIGVARARRRRGIAAALLDHLPAGRVLLEVAEGNDAARAAYARAGFAAIARRERYYRDGSAALVMERTGPDTKECTTS